MWFVRTTLDQNYLAKAIYAAAEGTYGIEWNGRTPERRKKGERKKERKRKEERRKKGRKEDVSKNRSASGLLKIEHTKMAVPITKNSNSGLQIVYY